MMSTNNALVIDDTAANRDFLERLIAAAKFEVHGVGSAKAALDLTQTFDDLKLAIIDMELPDMSGMQLTAMLRQRFPRALLVVATMHDDVSLMESVFQRGGNIFLVKPHGFMELFKRLTTGDLAVLRDGEPLVIDMYGPHPFKVATK